MRARTRAVGSSVFRSFALVPSLAAIVATAATNAQDCPPDAVGCHRAPVDFHHLDRRLPSISLDTGWVPSSGPIQVRFEVLFMGETEVALGGTLVTYWPFGLSMATPGRTNEGTLRMAWGLELRARMRFSAEIGGTRYEWEGDVPFVPLRDLRLADAARFDPFVLPGATPRPVLVRDRTDAVRVVSVGLASVVGGAIPGLDGGFELTLAGDLTTSYRTDRIVIDDARAPVEMEGAVVPYWPPPEGFGPFRDVVVRPTGTLSYEGDVLVRPSVYVELLGRRFDLAAIEIPVPVVRTSNRIDFDPAAVHVPLPDVDVFPERLAFGDLLVGETRRETLVVRNRGEAELVVSLEPLPMPFNSSATTLRIPAASEAALDVVFEPSEGGTFDRSFALRTNDPDAPSLRVMLEARARRSEPPDAGARDASSSDAEGIGGDGTVDATPEVGGVAGGACGCTVAGAGSSAPVRGWIVLVLVARTAHRRARRSRPDARRSSASSDRFATRS